MSVENHVVSLETAKRMHELGGLNVKPVFMYWTHPDIPGEHYELVYTGEEGFSCNEFCVPTYLATEILEELPKCLVLDGSFYFLEFDFDDDWIHLYYRDRYNENYKLHSPRKVQLQETLAAVWCELKEKGII